MTRNYFWHIDQRICYLSTLPQKQQKLLEKYKRYLKSQEILQIHDPDSDKVHITIKRIVRDWTDLGAEPNEVSIEPSYEDLRDIIVKLGFEFVEEDTKVTSKYSQNPSSMAQLEYRSVLFVVRKTDGPDGPMDEPNGN